MVAYLSYPGFIRRTSFDDVLHFLFGALLFALETLYLLALFFYKPPLFLFLGILFLLGPPSVVRGYFGFLSRLKSFLGYGLIVLNNFRRKQVKGGALKE